VLSKARFQSLLSYSRKKERIADGVFFVDGWRWLAEALASPGVLRCVVAVPGAARTDSERSLLDAASEKAGEFHEALPAQVAKLAGAVSSSGVVALVNWSPMDFRAFLGRVASPGAGLVAVLDSVSDPGNAGTVVRTGDWFGARGVLFGAGSVEPSNPKVVRSTMGSLFHLPIATSGNIAEDLAELRQSGFVTVGAVLNGEDSMDFPWPERVALVVGNEAHGISAEVAAEIDHGVSIPSFGRAESLNAAVAFAVLTGGWRNQHRTKS
jgi:TrmH family RNA methyltransferase